MIKFMKVCGWLVLGIILLVIGLVIIEQVTGTEIIPREELSYDDSTSAETEYVFENPPKVENTPVIKAAPVEFVIVERYEDFLGGNTITVWIKNLTNKTIAWVEYTLSFYDVKGEPLYDYICGVSSMTWYDGPIRPDERISIASEIFHESNVKYVVVDKITICYEDGVEEVITQSDLTAYTQIIFNSDEFMVWTSANAASYHVKGCNYYINNNYDIELSMSEACAQGKSKCPHCLP